VSEPAQLVLDPRVQLELTLEEAAELRAWLTASSDRVLPPVARELRRALEQALDEPPMA